MIGVLAACLISDPNLPFRSIVVGWYKFVQGLIPASFLVAKTAAENGLRELPLCIKTKSIT
jgi:hypothetical protein